MPIPKISLKDLRNAENLSQREAPLSTQRLVDTTPHVRKGHSLAHHAIETTDPNTGKVLSKTRLMANALVTEES